MTDNLLKNTLKNKMLLVTAEDDLQHLRVLIDEKSYKIAQKLYKDYISEMDFSRFHAFMQEFDRLLARFGGKPLPPPKEQQQGNQQNPKQQQQQGNRQRGVPLQNPKQTQRTTPQPQVPAPVEDEEDE